MDNIVVELTNKAFMNREYSVRHSPLEKEFEFYHCVQAGDIEGVKRLMTKLAGDGSGNLSENKLRNVLYHFIVTIALVTRFCIEGGMEKEMAYSLSDLYINRADKCNSVDEINIIHKEAVFDYTNRMKHIAKENIYSKQVLQAIDYIYDNLHSKIKAEEIAELVGLSMPYMSKLFHKEVGIKLSEYIIVKKIEASQNMLKYSDYSPLDIANYLGFSSHSHFISVFGKYTGMTPNEYRKKYYRSNWR